MNKSRPGAIIVLPTEADVRPAFRCERLPVPPVTTSFLATYLLVWGDDGPPPLPPPGSEPVWYIVGLEDGSVSFRECRPLAEGEVYVPAPGVTSHVALPLPVPPTQVITVEGTLSAEAEAQIREFVERMQPTPPQDLAPRIQVLPPE